MEERILGSVWLNGGKDDCKEGWMNQWINEWKDKRKDEWMNEWINEWMNEWIKNQCLDDAVHRLRLTPEIWSGQGLLGLKIRLRG